jgi:long-chain acyl-CoA synthetase
MASSTQQSIEALKKSIVTPPPLGSPYALPIPGSAREGRSAIYRQWQYVNGPLLQTFHPDQRTVHDLFEYSVSHRGNKRCLGWRPWDPATRTWENKYVWLTYDQVAERRKNLGAGIVELHHRIGVTADKYGVGLWAQNRPEWQITGK